MMSVTCPWRLTRMKAFGAKGPASGAAPAVFGIAAAASGT